MSMKTKFITIIWILMVISTGHSQLANNAAHPAANPLNGYFPPMEYVHRTTMAEAEAFYQQQIKAVYVQDEWRVFHGITNNVKQTGVEFRGKIMDVTPNGIRMEGPYGDLLKVSYQPQDIEYSDYFVANYPHPTINDQIISSSYKPEMAFEAGTYTYSTVNGGSRTILKLDYGIPCDPPQWALDQQKTEQLAAEKAKADIKAKDAARAQIGAEKALAANQAAADKGDEYGLLRMGERYRDGEGVEKDLAKAHDYLQKAATAGSPTAATELAALPAQMAGK